MTLNELIEHCQTEFGVEVITFEPNEDAVTLMGVLEQAGGVKLNSDERACLLSKNDEPLDKATFASVFVAFFLQGYWLMSIPNCNASIIYSRKGST